MYINGVKICETFAEAFSMNATRVIVTACNKTWVQHAVQSATGFATSVIACKVEAGLENVIPKHSTPDGRDGASILFFSTSGKLLEEQVQHRVSQSLLTSPTSAVYSGIDKGKPVSMGKALRYFGDGYQISKQINGRRYWRIPVMDGEFICEDTTHRIRAIGGGNFLIIAKNLQAALSAAEQAVTAIESLPDVITPFPGGVVRSGSKVGSKYRGLTASTNDAYCPTLRGIAASALPEGANAVLEIVIDGLNEQAVAKAMRVGIRAACDTGSDSGLLEITTSNFGGKLGKYHFHLHEILS